VHYRLRVAPLNGESVLKPAKYRKVFNHPTCPTKMKRRILFLTLVAVVILVFLLQTPLFVPTWYVTLVLFVVSCLGIIFMMHAYRVEVVQNITGLDTKRARRILRASWTSDWSRVPDEDLRLREIDEEEKLNRFRDPYRSFERMVVAAICIEQAKRKTYASWEPFVDEEQ
jgi:hypothetical protein